jgi:hypothetical protein
MAYILNNDFETIMSITRFLIESNGMNIDQDWAYQVQNLVIDSKKSNRGMVYFSVEGQIYDDFTPRKSIGLEASILDINQNKLHAILFKDQSGNLMGLEVFSWEGSLDKPDLKSMQIMSNSNLE